MTVAEMKRRMPYDEFVNWAGFSLIEPFGDEWRQTCTIEARIANVFGGKQGGGQFKVSDLMPTEMSREQSSEEMEQVLMAQLSALGKHG